MFDSNSWRVLEAYDSIRPDSSPRWAFFRAAVFDALNDGFNPCRNRVHAWVWVLCHWRYLRAEYPRWAFKQAAFNASPQGQALAARLG